MAAITFYGKTAHQWVTELCKGAELTWKISTNEGTVTCELTCEFSNEQLRTQVSGSTEEEAKEQCSENLLFHYLDITRPKLFVLSREDLKIDLEESEYLHPLTIELETGVSSQAFTNAINNEVLEAEEAGFEDTANYIGSLQEECQKRCWQLPIYQEVSKTGPPHMPQFTLKCKVGAIEKCATKSNKKDAKTMAAYKVLENLKSIQFNTNLVNGKGNEALVGGEPAQASSSPSVTDDDGLKEIMGKMRQLNLHEHPAVRQQFISEYYDLIQTFVSLDHNEEQIRHSLFILDWICQRAGIELVLYEPLIYLSDDVGNFHSILKMTFPFSDFTPSIILAEGIGYTKIDAVQNCALTALRLLVE